METKKAYGIVMAIGAKLGERAKTDREILDRIRATSTMQDFDALIRVSAHGLLPDTVIATFLVDVVTPDDWIQWRSRLLLQAKLTRDGGRPAPGHESGRGVGRP